MVGVAKIDYRGGAQDYNYGPAINILVSVPPQGLSQLMYDE